MDDPIFVALERAQKQYHAYYQGKIGWVRVRRFFRYPLKYIRRGLALKLGWWSTTPLKISTCWRKELFVLLPDKNAGSLYYFGFLARQEYPLSRYLARTLMDNDVFYDIGANYGFYSALASVLLKRGEVHAFEPHPLLAECLRKSFSQYVYINEVALMKVQGQATFYDKYGSGHSGGSTIVEKVAGKEGFSKFTVLATSLDAYVSEHTAPTIVKIDVEGAERLVLEGGERTLKKYRPRIVMEVWGRELWEEYSRPAVELLFALGYAANEIGKDGILLPLSPAVLQETSLKTKYNNIAFLP